MKRSQSPVRRWLLLVSSPSVYLADMIMPVRVNYSEDITGGSMTGVIDEVRIYDRALDADEVAALAQTLQSADCLHFFPVGNGKQ